MKNRRLQFQYRENASVLHRAVGDCLRDSSIFQGYKIYQEYPVNQINYFYPSGREKFDWVILDLAVVIECHGEQHYRPVDFSGSDPAEAELSYKAQLRRDIAKEEAARDVGFAYIVVPYTDAKKISETYLLRLVEESNKDSKTTRPVLHRSSRNKAGGLDWKEQYSSQKKWIEETGIGEQRRQAAREYRKEQYRKLRLRLKEGRGNE